MKNNLPFLPMRSDGEECAKVGGEGGCRSVKTCYDEHQP